MQAASILLLVLALPPLAASEAPAKEERTARAIAVVHLAESCASCHTKSSPKADPKALAVFDFERPDWPTMLTEERLPKFRLRLYEKLDEAGQRTLDLFISGELALRRRP